ncbi:hemolysin family protein [Rhodoferax sp.]|jgi:putative hemolysin|uniref:hemolysin family protein n=1 Tax=Rhodoferax sp. TaxID=50421 RepID=UPI00271C3F78|nr:hemolysin family protein [Rhodoferax sp.]MDO9145990.1 hemolysin family protein [Rhodoferax sp.]MDP1527993.1 hemolysin family protein [Rhodoferax sp.]MDP1942652.1 hemolysin family protein [Rhodoferax sp.]MDP2439951.1 hemolysin family protein [Rhodoferax sp.]MDP3191902.1 hemolysin family protein [Rhodoferax sp.]
MEFLLIVFLTLLNGVFAMSELALAASRKSRLNGMADEGDKGAQAALTLLGNPNQFLSTVQVGITSIGVLNGIVGEAAFSGGLAAWLQGWGLSDKAAAITATALVVTIITYTTIIFGELVPKRIGQLYPEQVSRWVSRPMLWLARAAGPFVKLLSGSTAAMLRLLRIDTNAARAMTEEEITASLEEGVDAGVIEEHEHQMVQNVFGLDDRQLTSLMVPRAEVDWLDADISVAQALQKVGTDGAERAHSWYPVCRGSMDDVVGKVSVAHMLALGSHAPGTLADYVTTAVFVPETLSAMTLLEQFRAKVGRLVLVVDEYGVVQGLLTPHDLLEAITGELQPSVKSEAWAVQREDGSWLLDGMMPVSELKARLAMDELPLEERGRYNTLAGLLMAVSGHMPVTGEKIECEDWLFEVVDLDGKRVDKVLASQMPSA